MNIPGSPTEYSRYSSFPPPSPAMGEGSIGNWAGNFETVDLFGEVDARILDEGRRLAFLLLGFWRIRESRARFGDEERGED